MTQGGLEKLPAGIVKALNDLEIRIMEDMVRRIRINGFSTASADWQFTRLKQLGMSEDEIKKWVQEVLDTTEEEIDHIYSDDAYEEYMGHGRAYDAFGRQQIPFEENAELQQLIEAVRQQTRGELERITGSMGFVLPTAAGNLQAVSLTEYYQKTLDDAVYDIQSGAFDYNTVLSRTIEDMTRSGIRWVDYASGRHNRIAVAARRAVMTGFRQVQGKINEQTARELGTNSYEVTVHIGARPTHQEWEGKVWTMDELHSVCGLGTVTGLHGANCYHDYIAFIPGVSARTYTDEQLDRIHKEENTPKTYNGKEYTTYEALQRQRQLETRARKYREDVHLLEEGGGSEDTILAKKARYQGTMQEYKDFSKRMGLPMQKDRIYQDGLKVDMRVSKRETLGKPNMEYEGVPKSWGAPSEMSDENAVKGANPRYQPGTYNSDKPYNSNCANCVVASEMRFRGYDVIARAKNENRKLAIEPFTAWKDAHPVPLKYGSPEINDYMTGLPDNSRIQVAVRYPDSIFSNKNRPNHTFIVYKKNNKVFYADPQNGGIIKNVDRTYFDGASEIWYCRIDNLEISDRGCTACERVKKP